MMDKLKIIEKNFELTKEKLDEVKKNIEQFKIELERFRESLVPTDAVFKDGHREKVVYFKQIDTKSFEFATTQGMYAFCETDPMVAYSFDNRSTFRYPMRFFYKLEVIADPEACGHLTTRYITVDIDRVEFEIKEGR